MAEWAARVRRGIYWAVRRLGLSGVLTLTLPADLHRPETLQEAIASRRAAQVAFNRFRTFLRKRGFMGDYVSVPEAHGDGTCHLHVAFNDLSLVAAFGGYRTDSMRKAQAFLQDAWTRAGGGFLWWGHGKKGDGFRNAAAELSKYIGKSIGPVGKARPPWTEARWCTVEGGFRKRPWHHYWPSRKAGAIIRGPSHLVPEGDWELVAESRTVSRRCPLCRQTVECWHRKVEPQIVAALSVAYVAWSPGRSVAICPECDGHLPDPSLPFACHHAPPTEIALGCWCNPPWLFEYVAPMPRAMARFIADPEAHDYDCACGECVPDLPFAVEGALRSYRAPEPEPEPEPEPLPPPVVRICACRLCLMSGAGCRTCPRCGSGVAPSREGL